MFVHLVLLCSLDIVFDHNKLGGDGPANLWFADGPGRQCISPSHSLALSLTHLCFGGSYGTAQCELVPLWLMHASVGCLSLWLFPTHRGALSSSLMPSADMDSTRKVFLRDKWLLKSRKSQRHSHTSLERPSGPPGEGQGWKLGLGLTDLDADPDSMLATLFCFWTISFPSAVKWDPTARVAVSLQWDDMCRVLSCGSGIQAAECWANVNPMGITIIISVMVISNIL